MFRSLHCLAFALAFLTTSGVFAQTAPDAGRILQELAIPPAPIAPSTSVQVEPEASADAAVQGGPRIELTAVQFRGNSQFDAEALSRVISESLGQSHDLAGLRRIATQITRFYRSNGYPFARAYLPPQRMTNGELVIELIEGRYGTITAVGDAGLSEKVQPFLSVLQPGDVIEGDRLERTVMLVGDLPGIELTPMLRPGGAVGTGDLEARVSHGPAFEGKLSADNHGNRYSGRYRTFAAGQWNSPFMLGDRLSASVMRTDESLWFGQLGYSLPLGISGLRGMLSYTHTDYELGEEFASLDATGTAKIAAAGVSYPLIRSARLNLILSAQYQYKDLQDRYGLVDVTNDKSSKSVPIALQFDIRDSFGAGGITYGALTWTAGELSLDSADLRAQDRMTANTDGGFQRLTVDVARVQWLDDRISLFARFAGQLADRNLDSSESFSLGGAGGVRAYPQGEGSGDQGWLAQLELRYRLGNLVPYVFYDAGRITIRQSPWMEEDNHRSLSGGGTGLRWSYGRIGLDAAMAWRVRGGAPESDTRDPRPRFWIRAEYRL